MEWMPTKEGSHGDGKKGPAAGGAQGDDGFELMIAQPEQLGNSAGEMFGNGDGKGKKGKTIPFPTAQQAAKPAQAPRTPGVPGDDIVSGLADRVLRHADQFAMPGKNGGKLDLYQLATAVIEETQARWRHDQAWIFARKCYVPGGPWIGAIGLKVAATFGQKDPDRVGKNVATTVTTMLGVAPKGAQFAKNYWDAKPKLALKNGTLDLTNPAQPVFYANQWDSDDRITWLITADWDPNVQNDAVVDQFLTSSIPDAGQREMMLEFLGLILSRWDMSLQSYLFQLGQGSNGKGLIQNVLRALVGEAVSAVSLSDLASNKFSAANSVDAAVNIVGDESAGILKDSSKLKQFTGGDAISMEAKFKMAYAAVPKVKLIFSLNQLPRITDFTNGFFRRPLIVEFPHVFAKNPAIEQALVEQDALSYWLKLFVEAYGRLKARGEFERRHTRNSLQSWREQNDIVSAIISEGFLWLDAGGAVDQDALMAGMKIFGELLGMKVPRLAEVIERLKQSAAWEAQGTGQQPTEIIAMRPQGKPRQIQGVSWAPGILDTQYRPSPAVEYQSIAEWLGIKSLDMPF